MCAGSSDGGDVSPSNWTGLVDLEEEESLHTTCKDFNQICVLITKTCICYNNPNNFVLSLRPLVLRVFRVLCDPPANPRTELLRLPQRIS